ncbi:MAG: hypothetical protein HN901_00780 [Campylobacteraceae bacterium]|nr:hypothetical protein [Campylobacteraceae bacterium]
MAKKYGIYSYDEAEGGAEGGVILLIAIVIAFLVYLSYPYWDEIATLSTYIFYIFLTIIILSFCFILYSDITEGNDTVEGVFNALLRISPLVGLYIYFMHIIPWMWDEGGWYYLFIIITLGILSLILEPIVEFLFDQ